jgi:hypothetical protein
MSERRGIAAGIIRDRPTRCFAAALLVDLPRAGETDARTLSLAPRGYRYMLRVALVPMRYENATLDAHGFSSSARLSPRTEGKIDCPRQ